MSKSLRRNSSEEIENELLAKDCLDTLDYDFRRNNVSEEPGYTLFVTIGSSLELIHGICKIEVILVENFTDLFIDFRGEIGRIWVNKALVYYNHETPDCSNLYNGSVLVISKSHLKPHLNIITVEYKALLMAESRGLYSTEDLEGKEPRRFLYTLSEPNHASLFMPVFGQLNIKGSFKLYVCHPAKMQAASNNRLKAIGTLTDDAFFEEIIERFDKTSKLEFWTKLRMKYFEADQVVSEFHTTGLLAFNMFAFAVGHFEVTETAIEFESRSVKVRFFTRHEWKHQIESVKESFAKLIKFGIDYFEKLTGKQFPYLKYDTVFVKEFHLDAIETPGMVIMYEEYIKFNELDGIQQLRILKVFLHEIAHMWFGRDSFNKATLSRSIGGVICGLKRDWQSIFHS